MPSLHSPPKRGRESGTKWPQAFGLTPPPHTVPRWGRSIPAAVPRVLAALWLRVPARRAIGANSMASFLQPPESCRSVWLHVPTSQSAKKKKSKKALLLYLHCTQVSTVQKICRCKCVLPSLTSPPFLIYVISIFLPCTVN